MQIWSVYYIFNIFNVVWKNVESFAKLLCIKKLGFRTNKQIKVTIWWIPYVRILYILYLDLNFYSLSTSAKYFITLVFRPVKSKNLPIDLILSLRSGMVSRGFNYEKLLFYFIELMSKLRLQIRNAKKYYQYFLHFTFLYLYAK